MISFIILLTVNGTWGNVGTWYMAGEKALTPGKKAAREEGEK